MITAMDQHTRTHTHTHPFNGPFFRTTWVGQYQKGKTNLDFTEARDSGWQWHQLGICKSAPRSRQITTSAPHHSFFTGRMPFLPPNQQRQSTEGTMDQIVKKICCLPVRWDDRSETWFKTFCILIRSQTKVFRL